MMNQPNPITITIMIVLPTSITKTIAGREMKITTDLVGMNPEGTKLLTNREGILKAAG
jgi:hypothetical protein